MELAQLEKISEEEWDSAVLNVRHRFSRKFHKSMRLPEGNTIEDLIYAAIGDLIGGKRKYNEDQKLEDNLYWIVKSNLSKLFRSADHNKCVRSLDYNEDVPEGIYELPMKIDRDWFLNEIELEIKGDEELELMFMAINDKLTKPQEISAATGLPVQRIYELKRKFADRLKRVQRKMFEDTIAKVCK